MLLCGIIDSISAKTAHCVLLQNKSAKFNQNASVNRTFGPSRYLTATCKQSPQNLDKRIKEPPPTPSRLLKFPFFCKWVNSISHIHQRIFEFPYKFAFMHLLLLEYLSMNIEFYCLWQMNTCVDLSMTRCHSRFHHQFDFRTFYSICPLKWLLFRRKQTTMYRQFSIDSVYSRLKCKIKSNRKTMEGKKSTKYK